MARMLLLEEILMTPVGESFGVKPDGLSDAHLKFAGGFATVIVRMKPVIHAVDIDTKSIEKNIDYLHADLPVYQVESWLTGDGPNEWPAIWDKIQADFPLIEEQRANLAKDQEREAKLANRRANRASKTPALKVVPPVKKSVRKR